MNEERLSMWVVYAQPADYPDKMVARRWLCGATAESTQDVVIADDLDGVVRQLPPGLMRLPRQAADDPVIVEVWI